MNYIGNNQPSAKLDRFIIRLKKRDSLALNWLKRKPYNKTLSIIQIRISATNRVTK